MGGCVSATPEEREAKTRSSVIERQLRRDARDYENTIKILLLGAGESGKSTVVKQMKIIHGDGYSESELRSFKSVIYGNLAASMRVVLNAMEKLGIPYANQASQEHARVILSLSNSLSSYETFPPEVTTAFIRLWRDAGVQECFSRAYDYQLNDSAPYYFENMDRLLREDYVPDEQDVLRSRVQTTGIIETSFRVKQLTYRVVDVGGQRSERRKWIQCFDDVRAVLFVCALSGYDMTLFEDGKTNRLEESLNLFQAICNNKFFVKTSMILFLNKADLFRDKITNSDRHLRLYFTQYTGPDRDVEAASRFIQTEFMERNLNKQKIIYPHLTTATDTTNIKVVFGVVLDTIIRENLEAANLL
jgi:guanine nucleotide-binding protein subunit alpha